MLVVRRAEPGGRDGAGPAEIARGEGQATQHQLPLSAYGTLGWLRALRSTGSSR